MKYSHQFSQAPEMIFKKEECIPYSESIYDVPEEEVITAEYCIEELVHNLMKCKEEEQSG